MTEWIYKPEQVPEIREWMQAVEHDEVPSCNEQRALMEYVRRSFDGGFVGVDVERLRKFMALQNLFDWELIPLQRFAIALFLCAYRDDGLPRWDESLLYAGRGFGKTGFGAFVSLCGITPANGIKRYNVDICANTEPQAKMTFDDAKAALESHKKRTAKAFAVNDVRIRNERTQSVLRYWSNNPQNRDGLRPGLVIYDEVHAYQNWDNLNVFQTALGKVDDPRQLYETTDGDVREGVLDSLKDRSHSVLFNGADDHGLLPIMCKLDSADQVHDESLWAMANPRITYSPSLKAEIEKEYAKFVDNPAISASFMTKRMNLPQGRKDIEVTSWDNILRTNRPLPDLKGNPCVVGIDFARTTDFVSAVMMWRVDNTYYAKHHSWWCTHSCDAERVKAPISEWAARGIVTIVDDVEVSPELVTGWLFDQTMTYDVRMVAIDDYRHTMFQRYLAEVGFSAKDKTVYRVRPSDIMRVQPTINSAFATGRIVWGDDPCMRWFTNNTKLEPAPNNNFKYGKIEPKSRKTDGFMAFVDCMCVESAIPEQTAPIFAPAIII